MKSAYELAMERLEKQAPTLTLTTERTASGILRQADTKATAVTPGKPRTGRKV